MKHAAAEALEALGGLLDQVRDVPDLKERSPSVFYLKSSAFLHFHDDPAGLFAMSESTATGSAIESALRPSNVR